MGDGEIPAGTGTIFYDQRTLPALDGDSDDGRRVDASQYLKNVGAH